MTIKIEAQVEIDEESGVIYVHLKKELQGFRGVTIIRVSGLCKHQLPIRELLDLRADANT